MKDFIWYVHDNIMTPVEVVAFSIGTVVAALLTLFLVAVFIKAVVRSFRKPKVCPACQGEKYVIALKHCDARKPNCKPDACAKTPELFLRDWTCEKGVIKTKCDCQRQGLVRKRRKRK